MDDDVRVSDADRERVAERLGRAQGEGRLELGEFDERVRAAYGAVTRADLAPLTADLPAEDPPGPRPRPEGAPRPSGARAAVGVWAVVSALNLGLWVVLVLATSGPVYPWWIWVAGPWGVVLALRLLAERAGVAPGGPRLPDRPRLPGVPAVPGLPVPVCGVRRRR